MAKTTVRKTGARSLDMHTSYLKRITKSWIYIDLFFSLVHKTVSCANTIEQRRLKSHDSVPL